ncbi:tetratricopeptide repeat protein, partial [Singulisphaera rosea]
DYLRRDPSDARAQMLTAQFAIERPYLPANPDELLDPAPALRALEHLQHIKTDLPRLQATAALYRGKAQYRLGRLVDAEASWEEALRLNPQIQEAGWHLLELYYLQGRIEASRRLALKMHQIEPDPHDRVQYLLEILRQEAQPPAPESLLGVFGPIVRANPKDFRALVTLGLAFERSGRIDSGLEQVRQAVRVAPEQPDAWEAWLTLLEEAGQIDNLERALERLPNDLSGSPRFARFSAKVAQERNDREAAVAGYRRAVDASSGDRTLAFRLIRALSAAGLADEANRLDRSLSARQEAVAEILPLYQELNGISTIGKTPAPDLYKRAGNLRERMGLRDEALAWYRLALKDRPDDAETLAAVERLSHASPSVAEERPPELSSSRRGSAPSAEASSR